MFKSRCTRLDSSKAQRGWQKMEFGHGQNPKIQNMRAVIYQSILNTWLITTTFKLYLVLIPDTI